MPGLLGLLPRCRSQFSTTATHRESAMRETKLILEVTACLATLIMLALAVADWVLKFLA
jgi:hypothetical protein